MNVGFFSHCDSSLVLVAMDTWLALWCSTPREPGTNTKFVLLKRGTGYHRFPPCQGSTVFCMLFSNGGRDSVAFASRKLSKELNPASLQRALGRAARRQLPCEPRSFRPSRQPAISTCRVRFNTCSDLGSWSRVVVFAGRRFTACCVLLQF